jgi:hypothetical protein
MEKLVMSECYADTLLIEALVPSERGYNHKMGCFKVEAEMKTGKLRDRFAVGILDNDKRQIKYLDEFALIDQIEGFLKLWKHTVRNHYVIQICPALERWIIKVCEIRSINLLDFGLSSELKELTNYTKTRSSLEDEKLKNLFNVISENNDVDLVNKLRNWIRILKERNYNVTLNELRNA